jgi:hypothetical protein
MFPLFLLVSIGVTALNCCSASFIDLHVGRINLGQFGAAHIPVFWAFCDLNVNIMLNNRSVVCLPVVIGPIWIIQVKIAVKPIFRVRNAFRRTILITIGWIMVDSVDLVDIEF